MSFDYEFANFRISSLNRELLRDGEPVHLYPKSFDVLVVLVQRRGVLVDKASLIHAVWADTAVEENSLARAVSDIRRALREGPKENRLVETISRRGYRFVAEVTVVPANLGPKRLDLTRSAPPVPSPVPSMTLAVLPFTWLTLTGREPSLSLGMADALITRLSNLPQVVVRPTSTIIQYKDPSENPAAIAKELDVDLVITGSIQRAGAHIRVTVQAVSRDQRRSVWGDRFDETSTNLFAIEDSIAERLAAALTLHLTTAQRKSLGRAHTRNSEAYELNLRGRYLLSKRSFREAQKAIECFQHAIDIDPYFAVPWVGIADARILIGLHGSLTGWLSPHATYPEAKRAALKSIELQPDLADAHASLAFVSFFYEWDWQSALREFKKAWDLQPYHVNAHHWYAMMCCFAGHHNEALVAMDMAMRADPVSLILNANRGYILYFARRYAEAMEQLRHALEIDESFAATHHRLGLVCSTLGRHGEAIDHFFEAQQYSDESPQALGALGYAYGRCGDIKRAQEVLKRLITMSQKRYVSAAIMADVCIGLQQVDQTLEWLDKAVHERSAAIPRLRVDPRLDWLRFDPRFQRIVELVRVPDKV